MITFICSYSYCYYFFVVCRLYLPVRISTRTHSLIIASKTTRVYHLMMQFNFSVCLSLWFNVVMLSVPLLGKFLVYFIGVDWLNVEKHLVDFGGNYVWQEKGDLFIIMIMKALCPNWMGAAKWILYCHSTWFKAISFVMKWRALLLDFILLPQQNIGFF